MRRGLLLLVALVPVVRVAAQADQPPLDADIPLIFVRTLSAEALRVLDGLHPELPVVEETPAAVPAGVAPVQLKPSATPGVTGTLALTGGYVKPSLGSPTPAQILTTPPVTAQVPGGLGVELAPPAAALPTPGRPVPAGLGVGPVAPTAGTHDTVSEPLVPRAIGPALRPGDGAAELVPVLSPELPGVAAGRVATIVASGPTAGNRSPAGTIDSRVSAALARLRSGRIDATTVAAARALPADELLRWLERTPLGESSMRVADVLVAALVDGHGHAQRDLTSGSDRLAVHYAGWLARRGDGRCVALLEELLSRRQGKAEQGGVPEVERLALYYRQTKQFEKAAKTWLRAGEYTAHQETLANYAVCAARDYAGAGNAAGAADCYRQVLAFGYGWATGLAIVDRAAALTAARRFVEAYTVLDEPLEGRYADQIVIFVEYQRGLTLLAEGRHDEAVAAWQKSLECGRRVPELLPGEGLEGLLQSAAARIAAAGPKSEGG